MVALSIIWCMDQSQMLDRILTHYVVENVDFCSTESVYFVSNAPNIFLIQEMLLKDPTASCACPIISILSFSWTSMGYKAYYTYQAQMSRFSLSANEKKLATKSKHPLPISYQCVFVYVNGCTIYVLDTANDHDTQKICPTFDYTHRSKNIEIQN